MTSDSSEDEDLSKLQEATDTQFINDSMFNNKTDKTPEEPPIEKLASLRRSKEDDDQFNLFRVSQEFQNYVAKQLTAILEKQIRYEERSRDTHIKPNKRKGGIKLLPTSTHYIKKIKQEQSSPQIKTIKKNPTLDEEEYDEEKFKSVAVSPQDILSKKETQFWSKRSKAPVYTYLKTKNGLILK